MTISGDYPAPVFVNGFSCMNCTDVERAQKNIDPADPAGGPFGVNDSPAKAATKAHKSVFDKKAIDVLQASGASGSVSTKSASTVATAYGGGAPASGTLVNLMA